MSLNRAQVMGHLGQDPEMRYMPSGEAVVNLSIATTDRWKDKQTGEPRERTEWHRVSFFGRKAEVIAEYFGKGDLIYVEGQIQTRKWQDNDGNDRYTTEIRGFDFQFCGPTSGSDQTGGGQQQQQGKGDYKEPPKNEDFDDDIPF